MKFDYENINKGKKLIIFFNGRKEIGILGYILNETPNFLEFQSVDHVLFKVNVSRVIMIKSIDRFNEIVKEDYISKKNFFKEVQK